MSRFTPTERVFLPADEPDVLAGAVLGALGRPLWKQGSLGFVRAFALGTLTLGVLPLFQLPRRLRDYIVQEQQQLWHLSEWIRLQTADPDAALLQQAAQQVRFNPLLALLTWLGALAAIAAAVFHFRTWPFDVRALYRFGYHVPTSPEAVAFLFAGSAAALLHWSQVVWHQLNVERFVRHFNQVAARQGLAEVPLPQLQLGLRPPWIAAAVVFALAGALWGVPLMLAAGAHRGYTRFVGMRTRGLLAERLRAMLAQRRAAASPSQAVGSEARCLRPTCQAVLPQQAAYCPRCGTRVGKRIDEVA